VKRRAFPTQLPESATTSARHDISPDVDHEF
jgi:hypothetical protein